jgi:hypothetical protein
MLALLLVPADRIQTISAHLTRVLKAHISVAGENKSSSEQSGQEGLGRESGSQHD